MVVMMLAAGLAHAQPPDLSGQWMVAVVAPPSTPAPPQETKPPIVRVGDMGSGWGKALTITQSATTLNVDYVYYSRGDMQPPMRFAFSLDGTETVNRVMAGFGLQELRSRAVWRDTALEITSTSSFLDPNTGAAVPVVETRTLSLTTPSTLTVGVTRHGVLGGKDTTTTTIYQKGG